MGEHTKPRFRLRSEAQAMETIRKTEAGIEKIREDVVSMKEEIKRNQSWLDSSPRGPPWRYESA